MPIPRRTMNNIEVNRVEDIANNLQSSLESFRKTIEKISEEIAEIRMACIRANNNTTDKRRFRFVHMDGGEQLLERMKTPSEIHEYLSGITYSDRTGEYCVVYDGPNLVKVFFWDNVGLKETNIRHDDS